jgi:glucokinase
MRTVAAVGIGGTNFYYAGGTASGEILTDVTASPSKPGNLAFQVVDAVRDLKDSMRHPPSAVCVACRGMIDHERGAIEYIDINNGPTYRDIDLRTSVEEEIGLPLYIENDCTGATLAEYHFGAGRRHDSIVHVTMGTGIGAGVIDGGRVVRGEENFAGEVGGIPVGPADGLACFGVQGAWEAYCSGPGILDYVAGRLEDEDRETTLSNRDELRTQHVFEAGNGGDEVATEYLDAVARYNAAGFGTIANMYNPGLITVGGGVAQNNPGWVLDGIDQHIGDFLVADEPAISITEFEDEIGVYGALAQLAHREEPRGAPSRGVTD